MNNNFAQVLNTHASELLEIADDRGCTLYHYAAIWGRVDVANHLRQYAPKLSLDKNDEMLWRPIHYAFKYDNDNMAAWLHEQGASLGPCGYNNPPLRCEDISPKKENHPILHRHKLGADLSHHPEKERPIKI